MLIQALQNVALYPHPVSQFQVIETHLSWVILTGTYAYKIKKSLNLGFQDFTTLEKRKYYCELEISLNKRFTEDIYLEIIPITGSTKHPHLKGTGVVIEYAIKMTQFPQEALLHHLAQKSKITPAIIDNLAKRVAQFHHAAQIAPLQSEYGTLANSFTPIQDNFDVLKKLAAANSYLEKITAIEQWAQHFHQQHQAVFAQRKTAGFIRACHGDLHLANIVMLQNKPVIFDCIEFNENFRWIDVMNDVGFLAMDLDYHHLEELQHLFVNKYWECSYDYTGALLLKFYQCYFAMVRAKVAALQIHHLSSNQDVLKTELTTDLHQHLLLAYRYIKTPQPVLYITVGPSGSGKTFYTEQLLMQTGAVRLRADIFRKQMQANHSKHALYSNETTQKIYLSLQAMAKTLLQNQQSVIIDATCLKKWQRQLFFELTKQLQLALHLLVFETPQEILEQRIQARLAKGDDVSQADKAVLLRQLSEAEPLTEQEKNFATIVQELT